MVDPPPAHGAPAGADKPREERRYTEFFPDLDPATAYPVVTALATAPASPALIPRRALAALPVARFRLIDVNAVLGPPDEDWDVFKRPDSHYIRNAQLTEADLAHRVEYDMDEEDRAWLDLVNAQRARSGLNPIPTNLFETLIDCLEKEWFDLTKTIQRTRAEQEHAALPAEDAACNICGEEECENSNAIVFCDGCNLAVHQDCYGVPYIPEGQWLCRRCMISPETHVPCLFCPYTDGAFKKTTMNKWAHLLCALWIPEVTVANPVYMEPIDHVDRVPKSRWRLTCAICKRRKGACIQCSNKACYTAYHVTCARKARLYLKVKPHRSTGEPTFRSYCDRHAPADHVEPPDWSHAATTLERSDAELALQAERSAALAALLTPATTADTPAFRHYNALAPVIPEYLAGRLRMPAGRAAVQQGRVFITQLARYWSLKRRSRRGAPLIKRLHLEPWTASATQQKAAELESERQFQILQRVRKDLERIRMLVELVRKREREKLKRFRLQREYVEGFIYPLARVLWPVLHALQDADARGFFAEPVSALLVPDYRDVIADPMDLGTMGQRLAHYEYRSLDDFEADAHRVIRNAQTYNRPDTPYYRAAARLRRVLEDRMRLARAQYRELPLTSAGTPLVPPSPLIFNATPQLEPRPVDDHRVPLSARPAVAQTEGERPRSRSMGTQPTGLEPPPPPASTSPATPEPMGLRRVATPISRQQRELNRLHTDATSADSPTAGRGRRTASRKRSFQEIAVATSTPPRSTTDRASVASDGPATPQTPAVVVRQRGTTAPSGFRPGDIVWAKIPAFPWFPADVVNPRGREVPSDVAHLSHGPEDRLIRFYDRDLGTKRSFAWVDLEHLKHLGWDAVQDERFVKAGKRRPSKHQKAFVAAYAAVQKLLQDRGELPAPS
ncbi:hypothetical protein IWQ60_003837 [Tieghemiomyces parasiticus]|uniref:Peregrin n=1 Tax=Tieghemiomyces parasiticus TaxID=78921 RepID=A0A9W8AC46_9FUNG|nr:hypothetical protein IWQ60_003837 [Tieghemiomyces parasiticus]